MAAAVITVARPTNVQGCVIGNKKLKFRTITADTGDYTPGGFTVTATQLGLKAIDIVLVDGGAATDGTAGATAEVVGVTYPSRTSVTFQLYQGATSADAPLNEKGAEAYVANFTIRVAAIGT